MGPTTLDESFSKRVPWARRLSSTWYPKELILAKHRPAVLESGGPAAVSEVIWNSVDGVTQSKRESALGLSSCNRCVLERS